MANPDCDDGWLKYAHELDAALAVADFTKGARIVLREVFAQIFGPAKLKAARISPTEIAHCTGQVKTGIVRAVRELVESDALRKRPDGSYAFNKNYETWVFQAGRSRSPGSPRLTKEEVKYCKKSPDRAKAYKAGQVGQIEEQQGNQTVTTGNQTVTTEDVDEVTKLLPDGNSLVTATVTKLLPDEGPPPAPPLVNRREEENWERLGEFPPPHAHALEGRSTDGGASSSPNVRTPEDLAMVREAMQILASHPNSGHLADRVGREHNTPDNVWLAGWKWVVAASKAFDRSKGGGMPVDWPYFRGIVRNARRDEYDRIQAEMMPSPAVNGFLAPARKLTPAERRKAQGEAIRRAAAQLDPDEET